MAHVGKKLSLLWRHRQPSKLLSVCIIKQKRSFLLLNAASLQKKFQVSKCGATQHFNFEIY